MPSYRGARTWQGLGEGLMRIGDFLSQQRYRDELAAEREASRAQQQEQFETSLASQFAMAGGGRGRAPQIEMPIGPVTERARPSFEPGGLLDRREPTRAEQIAPSPEIAPRAQPSYMGTDPRFREVDVGGSQYYLPDPDVAADVAARRALDTFRQQQDIIGERAGPVPGSPEAEQWLETQNRIEAKYRAPRLSSPFASGEEGLMWSFDADSGTVQPVVDPITGEQMTARPRVSEMPEAMPGPGSIEWNRVRQELSETPPYSDYFFDIPADAQDMLIRQRLSGAPPPTREQLEAMLPAVEETGGRGLGEMLSGAWRWAERQGGNLSDILSRIPRPGGPIPMPGGGGAPTEEPAPGPVGGGEQVNPRQTITSDQAEYLRQMQGLSEEEIRLRYDVR